MLDVIIIGNGPAGISASLYTERAGIHTLVLGKDKGALTKTDKIANYYGFPEPIPGQALTEQGIAQAKGLGVDVEEDEIFSIDWNEHFIIQGKKARYEAKVLILATGLTRNTPKIRGFRELGDQGVSYCAVCDAFFYRGKDVVVLGNGGYAVHEAETLQPVVKSVTLLTNGLSPEEPVPEGILVNQKEIQFLAGDPKHKEIHFADGSQLDAAGIFVAMGSASSSDLARKLGVLVGDKNNIEVNEKMETNIPGLYAAGDCTGGMLQIAKAVYEGAMAGSEAVKYIRKSV